MELGIQSLMEVFNDDKFLCVIEVTGVEGIKSNRDYIISLVN